MELTDYQLYNKVCNRLRNFVFPIVQLGKNLDKLELVRQTTSKLLPDIHVLSNLITGRPDVIVPYSSLHSFFQWDDIVQHAFMGRLIKWLYSIEMLPNDPTFYATYNIINNRIANIYQFNAATLIANFGLGNKKGDRINPIRVFCYFLGGPLTTIQRREVSGRVSLVLCSPKEAVPYAT